MPAELDGSQLALGLLLGLTMAGGGYWRGALSRSGAFAAAVVGTIVFGLGGWSWGLLLVAFFVLSSALSRYGEGRKREIAEEKFAKGSRRDWAQVVANGGFSTLLALLLLIRPEFASRLFIAHLGAMASVTADTWATELGTLSGDPPRLVTTWQPVPPGSNGAISLLGTLAALVGGLFIGTLAYSIWLTGWIPGIPEGAGWLPMIGAIGGLGGSMIDSLLGATVQRINYCPRCESETEKDPHRCGTATHAVRGWLWMDNDMVNFIASAGGSIAAQWAAFVLL